MARGMGRGITRAQEEWLGVGRGVERWGRREGKWI